MKTWDLVAKVPFFRDIGAAAIAEIARLLRPRAVGPGTVVVRRGEAGDCMYFIVEGEIKVQIDPPLRLGAGSFFGEIALITGAPRSATAVAVALCTLLVLDIVDFRQFAVHNPVLDQAIRDEAERRLGGGEVSATSATR